MMTDMKPEKEAEQSYWCFFVNRLYYKLLIAERYVSYFTPRESYFWRQSNRTKLVNFNTNYTCKKSIFTQNKILKQ